MRAALLVIIAIILATAAQPADARQDGMESLWITDQDAETQTRIDEWFRDRGYLSPISEGPEAEDDYGQYGELSRDRLGNLVETGDHRAAYIMARRILATDFDSDEVSAEEREGVTHLLVNALIHGYTAAAVHLSHMAAEDAFAPGLDSESRSQFRVEARGWLEVAKRMNDPFAAAMIEVREQNPMLGLSEEEAASVETLAEQHLDAIREQREARGVDVDEDRPPFFDEIFDDILKMLQM